MICTAMAKTTISRTRRWPTWARYATTVVIVAVIFVLRRAANPILPPASSTGLSAALAAYLPPIGSLAIQNQGDIVGLGLFAAVGAVISLTVETLHRALADHQCALMWTSGAPRAADSRCIDAAEMLTRGRRL
jgi:hypothetical protein